MSPNNLILVAHMSRRSYVFADANADDQWSAEWAAAQVRSVPPDVFPRPITRRTRAQALVLAHNLQLRLCTEYGVREVFVRPRKQIRKKAKSALVCLPVD